MLKDRVKVNIDTTGSGTLTIGSPYNGFQGFSSLGSGNIKTYYSLTNDTNWETGEGTYYSSSETFSRDKVFESSSSGTLINLSGSSTLFITYPAKTSVYLDSDTIPVSGEYLYAKGDGAFSTSSYLKTGNATIDGTTTFTLVDTNPTAIDIAYSNAAKYLIKAEYGSDIQILECLAVCRDSSVYITLYGVIYTNTQLVRIDAQVQSYGHITLYATATNSNTIIRIYKTLI